MGLVDAWGGNALGWFFAHLIEAPFNLIYALTHPSEWLAWLGHVQISGKIADLEAAESLIRFIYYGASWELFFVFMQRVFAVSEISIGLGMTITHDVSWWSEELKFYNALIVCLCVSYTFVQGGHVRVDLVYSAISYRAKKVIDMFGSMILMVPAALLTYFYGWFFLWRSMVTPKLSASDTLKDIDKLLPKARALKWNVETIGFSPNGFNAYFLFKILLVTFTILVILQAIAFLYRSYLEFKEGPESDGKHLDRDSIGDPTAELVAEIH